VRKSVMSGRIKKLEKRGDCGCSCVFGGEGEVKNAPFKWRFQFFDTTVVYPQQKKEENVIVDG
jgi:hypothetical protein